jgi:geranylgeranyl diphosphate synthase type II
VHKQFGEPLALLTGDALIILAYQALAHAGTRWPQRLAPAPRMASWPVRPGNASPRWH